MYSITIIFWGVSREKGGGKKLTSLLSLLSTPGSQGFRPGLESAHSSLRCRSWNFTASFPRSSALQRADHGTSHNRSSQCFVINLIKSMYPYIYQSDILFFWWILTNISIHLLKDTWVASTFYMLLLIVFNKYLFESCFNFWGHM